MPILDVEIPKLIEGANLYDFSYIPHYASEYNSFLKKYLNKLTKLANQITNDWKKEKEELDLIRGVYVKNYLRNADIQEFLEYVVDLICEKFNDIEKETRLKNKKGKTTEEVKKENFAIAKKDVIFNLLNCNSTGDWSEIREELLYKMAKLVNAYDRAFDSYKQKFAKFKENSQGNENSETIKEFINSTYDYLDEQMSNIMKETENADVEISILPPQENGDKDNMEDEEIIYRYNEQ